MLHIPPTNSLLLTTEQNKNKKHKIRDTKRGKERERERHRLWSTYRVRGFGENVRQFIPRLRFFLFFKMEISSRTLASWDDCKRVFPDELRVRSFPDRFPHYACTAAQSAHSDFVGSRMYACLGVTCHLQFWQNDRDLFCATAVTGEWNGHQIRVSTQS